MLTHELACLNIFAILAGSDKKYTKEIFKQSLKWWLFKGCAGGNNKSCYYKYFIVSFPFSPSSFD